MIIAHVVLRLYTRSTTTKRTENKCSAIVACGWCVAQTLLLTRGANFLNLGVSAPLPTQRTLGSVRSTLSKTVRTHLFEIHICWRFTISQHFGSPHENCKCTWTAALSENDANCVNCEASVSRLRVRICSETRSDGLRHSFKNRQLFSDRMLLAFHTSCITSHVPRRCQIRCVTLCHLSIGRF